MKSPKKIAFALALLAVLALTLAPALVALAHAKHTEVGHG